MFLVSLLYESVVPLVIKFGYHRLIVRKPVTDRTSHTPLGLGGIIRLSSL